MAALKSLGLQDGVPAQMRALKMVVKRHSSTCPNSGSQPPAAVNCCAVASAGGSDGSRPSSLVSHSNCLTRQYSSFELAPVPAKQKKGRARPIQVGNTEVTYQKTQILFLILVKATPNRNTPSFENSTTSTETTMTHLSLGCQPLELGARSTP